MPIGMDKIVRLHAHACEGHWAIEIDDVGVNMRRHDGARQHEKIPGHLRNVAHRAVCHDSETAERGVHIGLHFSPKRPNAALILVHVLDDGDTRSRAIFDMLIVAESQTALLDRASRISRAAADDRCASKSHHRLQVRKRTDERRPVEPNAAPRRVKIFERITNGRRIDMPERFDEIGRYCQLRFPASWVDTLILKSEPAERQAIVANLGFFDEVERRQLSFNLLRAIGMFAYVNESTKQRP